VENDKPVSANTQQDYHEPRKLLYELKDVSSDAVYIAKTITKQTGRLVTHLWILFVLLPLVIGLLLAIAGAFR